MSPLSGGGARSAMPRKNAKPKNNSNRRTDALLHERATSVSSDQTFIQECENVFERSVDTKTSKLLFNEDGSIPDVALLRQKSKNGRFYEDSAMADALRVFEGVSVYLNHPKDGNGHDVRDLCGEISGAYLEKTSEGPVLRAKSIKPLGISKDNFKTLVETANHRVAMSIEAIGDGEMKDGILRVGRLKEGLGVAVVDRGGTNRNLFESTQATNEGVIADALARDERLEALYEIIGKATPLLYDMTSSYGANRDLTFAQKLSKCKTVATDLVSELGKFDAETGDTPTVTESAKTVLLKESVTMKPEEIKSLKIEEILEHRPDLAAKAVQPSAEMAKLEERVKAAEDAAAAAKKEAAEAKARFDEAEKQRKVKNQVKDWCDVAVKESGLPKHLQTSVIIESLVDADYSRFKDDKGDLKETEVKARMVEVCNHWMAMAAGSGTNQPGPHITEGYPIPSMNTLPKDVKKFDESVADDEFAAALCS